MDMENDIVNWFLTTTDEEARCDLLKRIINVLPNSDFNKCFNIISRCKKYRKREAAAVAEKKEYEESSAPKLSKSSGPEQVILPAPLLAKAGWLSKFRTNQVVSLDVEKVAVPRSNPTRKKQFEMRSAIISVVDIEGKEIYKSTIFRPFKSYHVNPISMKINGITSTSLQDKDCEDEEKAKDRLIKILEGKLVVGLDLEEDFHALQIPAGIFDTFDIQKHYYRLSFSENRKRVEEKLSIRSLVQHYYKSDMQPKGGIHQAKIDAHWTLRVFMEQYCKQTPFPELKDGNINGTNYIPHYNT